MKKSDKRKSNALKWR